MTHTSSFARRRAGAWLVGALLALLPGAAAAQQTVNGVPVGADGEPLARKPLQQHAAGRDVAYATTRSVGYFNTACAENRTGAADFDRAAACITFFQAMNNGFIAVWPRELHWSWGTTKTTWDSAVAKVPALANAIGGGWTVQNSHQTGFDDLEAADNALGLHHAGLTSVNDRSCLDQRPSFGAGFPLLAESNCPQTWGSEGWRGSRPVPLEVWAARFGALGNNFNFDAWRVSDAELDAAGVQPPSGTSPGKIIGNFQTYGYTSDYSTENLCGTSTKRNWGHVIPTTSTLVPGGCVGADPTRRRMGWPLGMEVRFDVFSFALPALKEIVYYQATFTNRSRDVYGVPLDLDSVYISLMNGWFGNSNIQQNPTAWVPEWGALLTSALPLRGPCDPARIVSDLTCARWGTNFGFVQGISALIMLKSPIGDQRNKWFNRLGSAFYNPAHPLASDTFTFNHGHLCGFRNCGATIFASNPTTTPDHEQRSFGMISSTEANVFGTRTPSGVMGSTPNVYWHTFRPFAFPSVVWAPGQPLSAGGGFNRWAPNMVGTSWDWGGPPGSMNAKDGVQDTLAIDGCFINGCAKPYADTLPNGKYSAYSNTHGTMGVGPIRLMADSSVSFTFAITTGQANDSAGFANQILAAIDNYMNFYLAPDAAPKCRVAGVTRASADEGQAIGISWDNTCFPGRWTDAFLNKQYNDLIAAPGNSALGRLRQLNPRLDDTLNFLRNSNIKRLYLFKSCNDGGVWTTADDCILGSPLIGDAPLATLGWQPYQTFDFDGAAAVPSAFTDRTLRTGQTYTYNVIGETRGANFQIINGDSVTVIGVDTVCARNCRVESLALAPVLLNTLSASTGEPNVARAYLPASIQAGARRSIAAVTDSAGPMPARRIGITVTNDSLVAASYRVLFGDSARAIQIEKSTAGARDSTRTAVILARGAARDTVRGTNIGGLTPSGGTLTRTTVSPGVDSVQYTWATGPVLALTRSVTGAAADALLVSSTLTGAAATPGAFHGNADYPKFDLSVSNSIANAFDRQVFLQPNGTTVPPLIAPAVTWVPSQSVQNNTANGGAGQANGDYAITWTAQAFGTGGQGGSDQFILNFSNPGASATAIAASISARGTAYTTMATASVAAAIQLATGVVTTVDSLVAVRLPFSVQNVSYGRTVDLAMRVRPVTRQTIVLGTGGDTLRVTVPTDAWVPGDVLYFLETVSGTPERVTFNAAVIGCDGAVFTRVSCNPVYPGTRGASVYLSPSPQQINGISYHVPVTSANNYTVTAQAPRRGTALTGQADSIRAGLASVRVVPNPYIMLSQYAGNVLLFTHVPPRGTIRIYTVAGQFVQRIQWTESNLGADGDLSWNLRTREGNLLGAGLYLYVLSATDVNGNVIGTRTDKFVIVR